MTNQQQLDMLKQGVEVWNKWREENPETHAQLSGGHFARGKLAEANLSQCNLSHIDLHDADLQNADFFQSNLIMADFEYARLTGARLCESYAKNARFRGAILKEADLRRCNLEFAHFADTVLDGADLTGATIGETSFDGVDLSSVIGLEAVRIDGPCAIGIDTIYKSKGKIPEAFLRGCGVPEAMIEYIPSLVGAASPIEFVSCFISHSTRDESFARRLYDRLQAERVRTWYAPEDVKGGRKLYDQIDTAIRSHDKVLLVLSEQSMASAWVVTELRRALRYERETGGRKLFPIRLTSFETLKTWECFDADTGRDLAVEVREYFIPDFSCWTDAAAFEAAFARLLADLRKDAAGER